MAIRQSPHLLRVHLALIEQDGDVIHDPRIKLQIPLCFLDEQYHLVKISGNMKGAAGTRDFTPLVEDLWQCERGKPTPAARDRPAGYIDMKQVAVTSRTVQSPVGYALLSVNHTVLGN